MAMRLTPLAIALVLLGGVAVAQQPGQPQPTPPPNPAQQAAELQGILMNWQKAMSGITKFHIEQASKTMKYVVPFPETTFHAGDVKFLAPRQFLVDLKKVEKGKYVPTDFFKIVCTGNATFQFEPKDKKIYYMPLPDKKASDDTIMGFLFPDMKMTEFQERYQLSLAPAPAGYEKFYYFLDILPKRPEDRQNFSKARLLLNRHNFLPRQLYYVEPNGNQVTWDFPKIKTTDANVQPNEFAQPTLPTREWQFARRMVESGPPPRVPPVQQNLKK
jgi:TIGR03009 family protein